MPDPSIDQERQDALDDLQRALTRLRMLPMPPAEDDPRREDWTEAVYVRGEAPYGHCAFCNVPRSPAGCLNLCEMSAGHVRAFNNGLQSVINKMRSDHALLEVLGGCTCPPERMSGYQYQRTSHNTFCPMFRSMENDS
jgi:hypothetical protein